MSANTGQSSLFSRDKLSLWGVITLMALLIIGIAIFIIMVLMPDVKRRSDYSIVLNSTKSQLRAAQKVQEEAPAKMQAQVIEAGNRLTDAAKSFLNEAESTIVVNRLYTYAEAAGVEIINLRAAPPIIAPTHSQRDYQFQVTGQVGPLLNFLGRIKEVELPGFVVGNVALVPNPAPTGDEDQHLLSMNVSVISSPFSTQTVLGPNQNPAVYANVGDLPLAEVQRQVEIAWVGRNWEQAINMLGQVVESSPENEAARIALYRAHVNYGYYYMDIRSYDAAKAEFESALALQPAGGEASAQLQQLLSDSTLSHRVEDNLRQQVAAAKAAGNWQEVIRLLRIVAAIDQQYGPVGTELTQAYIAYGDQLALAGDTVRAAEQYQLAQYPAPNLPQVPSASDVSVVAVAQSLVTTPDPSVVAAVPVTTETPMPLPTALPLATATPVPTMMPTATQTPWPTTTPTATSTQPPTATPAPSATPTLSPSPTMTVGPIPSSTPTATSVPSITTQEQPPTATYIVKQGDTLVTIAQRFDTTVEALRQANGLINDTIQVGQFLFIVMPPQQPALLGHVEHTVAPNETLYALAQRYGTTMEAIMRANGLSNTIITVGQRLLIPTPLS